MHGLQLGVSMGATMASSFSAAVETTKFKSQSQTSRTRACCRRSDSRCSHRIVPLAQEARAGAQGCNAD